MAQSATRKIRIHYRRASLEGGGAAAFTLQARLTRVMKGTLSLDANERLLPVTEDGQHRACLNYHEADAAFVADIMHLDGRSALPLWLTPKTPKPVAEIVPRELKDDEASLGEPLYILVSGNHLAAVERMGFRATTLQSYLNALLKKGGELEDGCQWRLAPKIETTGLDQLSGPVKKITFRPNAALVGNGPTEAPHSERPRSVTKRFGEFVAQGRKVIDMAVAAGADEAKLENLQSKLSNDLALKARLEISVSSLRRKSAAAISSTAVEEAFAELTSQGDVILTSEDGRTNGKLMDIMSLTNPDLNLLSVRQAGTRLAADEGQRPPPIPRLSDTFATPPEVSRGSPAGSSTPRLGTRLLAGDHQSLGSTSGDHVGIWPSG